MLVTIGIGVVELLVQNLRLLARSEVVSLYMAVRSLKATRLPSGEKGLES